MQKIFLSTAIAGTAVGIKLFPNTILLEKYRKVRARYGLDGNEKPVRKDIQQRFQEVMDDLKLSDVQRKNITLFNVHDIDVFHAGETWTSRGAIIGVPANYNYDNPNDITDQSITISNMPTNLNTRVLEKFRNSLVLSENAQKFALAREIITVTRSDLILITANIIFDILITVIIHNYIVSKFHLHKQQKLQHIFLLGILAFGCYVAWLSIQNLLDDARDREVNSQLLNLGPQYIQGGVEYYKKLSQRNQALRVLLGDKGPYYFTPSGNEYSWLMKRDVSITKQIDYFTDRIREVHLA